MQEEGEVALMKLSYIMRRVFGTRDEVLCGLVVVLLLALSVALLYTDEHFFVDLFGMERPR
tara:strand:- start:569 stop:751 length:183 start_codon:yes stop_codon:yes gene_type:complete